MKINFSGPFNVSTSYGACTRNIVKALQSINQNPRLFPIGGLECYPEESDSLREALAEPWNPNCPSVRLFHQNNLYEHTSRKLRVGYPIFELTIFNNKELENLRNQDALFVTSEWGKNIIKENNISCPTYVVPLGSDPEVFHKNVAPSIPKKKGFVRFGSIGKLEQRKLHDLLPTLFWKAFNATDKVELYLLLNNPFVSEQEFQEWVNYYKGILGDQVTFVPRLQRPSDVAAFMASCDIMLQPSRSEGWNMPACDAMSMELPIVGVDYSASTEFLNNSNSYLVKPNSLEIARDGKWFTEELGKWAMIDHQEADELVSLMRQARNDVLNGRAKHGSLGKFTWQNTARTMVSALEELMGV
jgi:hypothetical protein